MRFEDPGSTGGGHPVRRSVTALLIGTLLVGVRGRVRRTEEPSVTRAVTEGPPSSPGSEPIVLDPVVLTASLAEVPAAWRLVAEIPFGPRPEELGYVPEAADAYVGGVPPSFAVDRDGSIWILDAVKERLVHVSASGEYLGSVGRFPIEGAWRARDVQLLDGSLVVLRGHVATAATALTVVDRVGRQGPMRAIELDSEPVILYSIVPGAATLTGELHGYAATPEHPRRRRSHGLGGRGSGSRLGRRALRACRCPGAPAWTSPGRSTCASNPCRTGSRSRSSSPTAPGSCPSGSGSSAGWVPPRSGIASRSGCRGPVPTGWRPTCGS